MKICPKESTEDKTRDEQQEPKKIPQIFQIPYGAQTCLMRISSIGMKTAYTQKPIKVSEASGTKYKGSFGMFFGKAEHSPIPLNLFTIIQIIVPVA